MDPEATAPQPILFAHLLRHVDAKLLELLAALRPDEWELSTVAGQWSVRDVAAHLLDTPLRKLSLIRDGWSVERTEIGSAADLAGLINRLNREGVTVYRRLSPPVLIELMAWACDASARFHESLDPFAPAMFAVSWAGETASPNWFDTARELTERWHHQQQIRLATGRAGIMTPELYHPVLECFVRGLPHAYRAVAAAMGARVVLDVSGECGGRWQVVRTSNGWTIGPWTDERWDARVIVPQEVAWRVFTGGIGRAEALAAIAIEGDRALGHHVLDLRAIVA